MCINNSAGIFEDHLPKQKAHVVLEYCEPVYIKDLPKEQRKFVGLVKDIIEKLTLKIKNWYSLAVPVLYFIKDTSVLYPEFTKCLHLVFHEFSKCFTTILNKN